MNIALFASAYSPSIGGVEELCRQLALEYQRRRWGVCVLTNRWPRYLASEELLEGIKVFRLPFRTPDAGWKSKITYLLSSRLALKRTIQILKAEGVDLVHVQCVGCNGHYATLAASALRLPLLVTLQGEFSMDATQLFQRSAFARKTLSRALGVSRGVTACSRQTLSEVENFHSEKLSGKSSVIHNGIRTSDFANAVPFPHPRPYVLGLGRMVRQKGFDVLIRAMELLWKQKGWEGDLILAGDGPERGLLEDLVNQLGLNSKVIFTGPADRTRAAALFKGCELFVMPSRHEPFGIVCLEAMASNRPVVASSVGGVPEFVAHGESGWLVPPEDPRALCDGISRVLEDESLRLQIERGGLLQAQLHDWTLVVNQYEQVYKELLSAA